MSKKENQLVLEKIEVKNFAGIDDSKPVLICLGKDSKNIVTAGGDQEVGKTSFLTAIKGTLGANLELKEENYVNQKTGKIETDLEFVYKGRRFRCTWRKSYFKVQEYITDEVLKREGWTDQRNPTELLKVMFGYVAQTPESLRLKDGKAQIEEFKKVIGASLDETEIKLKKDFEEVSKSRTEANRSYTGIKKKLEETPMYVNWEEFEKLYSQEKSIESEKSKYLQAQEKSSKYQEAQLRLSSLQEQKTSKAKEIQDLENKLITLKNEQAALEEKIEVGEKYINDNSSVISEFEEISKSYLEISQYIADRNNWLGVVTSKKEMEEYESLIQAFDSQKDTIKAKLRELYTSMLPNIEGLEIISVEELDSDKKVGVYYKDKPISILSESELWGLYLQIWDALNIKFVIIDNISDLGSRAVEIINQMAAEGVYFFAAKMKRNEPMTITITEKVDD
jgi:hypothetical protein